MPREESTTVTQELDATIIDLQQALRAAAEAADRLRALAQRASALEHAIDDAAAAIEAARLSHTRRPADQNGRAHAGPTVAVPARAAEPPETLSFNGGGADQTPEPVGPAQPVASEELTTFRIEFESRPGPLDLRAVDDAVSEHPAVRDVALLDYDGRKATLKVWIVATASASEVRQSLADRTARLFPADKAVTVIALDDVA